MKHLQLVKFVLLLAITTAACSLAAVLPCVSPEDCPDYWTEERTRDHLDRCWKMKWCQKLMRQALEELRQEQLSEVNPVIKKDVFSSRGWGAGGMPSHLTYFTNRKILQQQQQRELMKQEQEHDAKTRHPRFSPLHGHNPQVALIADSRLFEEDVDEKTQPPEPPQAQVGLLPKVENQQYHHRNYTSLPQLFVSYGWGPLGK